MNILHICSYYTGSKVYKNLIKELSLKKQINSQNIFIPIRNKEHSNLNKIYNQNIHYHYSKCLNPITRIFFSFKQARIALTFFRIKPLLKYLKETDIIHAHTLYSDGVLAYILHKIYKIPYVITIRGTDVNLSDNVYIHWRLLAKLILKNAKSVIFISPKQKKIMEHRHNINTTKTILIPNGIDTFWIQNTILRKTLSANTIQAVFIGVINKNKNIKRLISAFFQAKNIGPNDKLVIIGGTEKDYQKTYGKLIKSHRERVVFKDKTNNKEDIKRELLKSNVFIMPSKSETFGLTYIEAISQATPVIYSKGQGIDGHFPEGEVGFSCNPQSIGDITKAIEKTLNYFPNGLNFTNKNPISKYSWDYIASELTKKAY